MAESGIKLAQAYVQIIPSAEGLGTSIKRELEGAGDEAGKSGGKKAGGAFASALGTTVKAVGAGIAAAATAVGAITKQAVEGFAEYEQLVGGAELMFGDAYEAVAERAANAYATVQMSQNEYLQQVNGFATGLKTAMGGDEQAAADLADRIVTAEADIVAATGASQESVQNAFNGIMKSNYAMLDNLQLGIDPTKEGMQEVIDKVNEWNAAQGNATDYQMGNLADMEAALVDYVAMQGMAGYAANEAADTISGSLASTKAAWANMLVGMADENADFDSLIGGLVDSATGLIGNLLPRIQTALSGVSTLIQNVAPIIVAELPGLVESVLPGLLESAGSIIESLITVLPGLIQTIVAALIPMIPMFINAGLQLFVGLIGALPEIIATITAAMPDIINGITTALLANIPLLIDAGVQLLISLVTNLPEIIITIVQAIPQIVNGIVNAIVEKKSMLIEAGKNLFLGLKDGIINAATAVWQAVKDAVAGIIDGAKQLLGIESPSKVFAEIGGYTMEGFAQGIIKNEKLVAAAVEDASQLASGTMASSVTISSARPASTGANVGREVANALRSVRVYIDGNRMVGYLVPGIDTALGVRQNAALRGAI